MLSVHAVAAAVGLVAAAPAPSLPSQYFVEGRITLPYGNISEPFRTFYDGVNNKQRVEYYDGLDVYITRGDLSALYQVNPVDDNFTCFETDGAINATSFFPDLSVFVAVPGQFIVRGQPAIKFSYNFTVGAKVNAYDFYFNQRTSEPLQYHWIGYDTLLGSHFDEYIFDYERFFPGNNFFNDSVFDKPKLPCGPFAGASYSNPAVNGIAAMFPQVPTAHFNDYVNDHGKQYNGDATDREYIFHRNVRFINAVNRKNKATGASLRLAVNLLADHTADEMAKRAGVNDLKRPADNGASAVHPPPASLAGIPDSIDWVQLGAVTEVHDQGICGSCWSFGTAQTIEGTYFRKTGQLLTLSEQEIVDCTWAFQNNGCDGGLDFQAYQWIQQNGGIAVSEEYGPYLMADGYCHARAVRRPINITGYVNVTSQSEPALLDALANVGPISVSIDAALQTFSFYSSGVFYDPNCASDPNDLDHTVLAVGYGTLDGEDYWLVKNSWSVHWGDNGYIKIARKGNDCGVATAATYVLM